MGPISCGIDAMPLLNYEKGIATDSGSGVDHVISVVGWGKEGDQGYWIVRNSWGEYWGEMGYVRVAFGALQVEEECVWATVKDFTAPERGNQVHCHEGGDNCSPTPSPAPSPVPTPMPSPSPSPDSCIGHWTEDMCKAATQNDAPCTWCQFGDLGGLC